MHLDLSGNSLHLDQLQLALTAKPNQLHHLGLGDLGLTQLPAQLLLASPRLRHLNLSANYLTSLDVGLLDAAPSLHTLDVSLNRWGRIYIIYSVICVSFEFSLKAYHGVSSAQPARAGRRGDGASGRGWRAAAAASGGQPVAVRRVPRGPAAAIPAGKIMVLIIGH